MKILTNLTGDSTNWMQRPRVFAHCVQMMCEANTLMNQIYLGGHRVPPLYNSGVRYQEEPMVTAKIGGGNIDRVEEFALIPAVIERGWGDCDDLAPWRAAELRQQGVKAKIRVVWRQHPVTGKVVYHVVVRLPNGTVECPSSKLGMPLSKIGAYVNQFAA